MAQPTTLPTWATSGSAAVTPPLSGTLSTGFVNGERPPNQYLNWLFLWICNWLAYLQAQVFVDGVIIIGGLGVDTIYATAIEATTVVVSGPQTIKISAANANVTGTGPTWQTSGSGTGCWNYGDSTGRLTYPLSLPCPCTITGYALHINKTSGSGSVTARLYSLDATGSGGGTETALGTGSSYPSSSGYDILTETGLSIAVTAGSSDYYLATTGGGTSGDYAFHLEIIFTTATL